MAHSSQQLFAGLDIGGTKIAAVVADSNGRIYATGVIATEPHLGPKSAALRATRLLCELEHRSGSEILAAGIGVPGLVDPTSGTILLLPNLPKDWQRFRIGEEFEKLLRRPVYLMNDARLAALGEYSFGAKTPAEDMLFVTVGTGIGGGLILGGKLRLGYYGAAGELGHHTIIPDGPLCGCGNYGCLETVASGSALSRVGRALVENGSAPRLAKLVDGDSSRVTATLMVEAANDCDTNVAEAIERAATYLGVGIANVVSITAVQEVVIGGGIAALGEHLFTPVRKVICERVRMFPSSSIGVRCSSLGKDVGALGGVALAAQKYNSNFSPATDLLMETLK